MGTQVFQLAGPFVYGYGVGTGHFLFAPMVSGAVVPGETYQSFTFSCDYVVESSGNTVGRLFIYGGPTPLANFGQWIGNEESALIGLTQSSSGRISAASHRISQGMGTSPTAKISLGISVSSLVDRTQPWGVTATYRNIVITAQTRAAATNNRVTITSPTTATTYTAVSTPLNLAGTTTGAAATSVTWVNDRGGSGTATGTTAWTVTGIVLLAGRNVLTVTAHYADATTSTDTLAVTYSVPPPPVHTITIQSPTSGETYDTPISTLSLAGITTGGTVSSVTWDSDQGGSGPAIGTTAWTVADIPLAVGSNILTVTAHYADTTTSTDSLAVMYTPTVIPPPTGDLPYYVLEVINKPYLASGGSIAGNIEQVYSPLGNRDLAGNGVFKIEIVTPTAPDTPIAVAFAVVGGSDAQTKTATMVGGVAAFTEPLNAALAAGEYKYRIECTSNCIVNKAVLRSPTFYYRGSGATAYRYLEFTTQPPDTAVIGTAIANIVVKTVNDAGTVQASTVGTCTIVNFSFAGPNKDTYLQGTKAVSFVAGVATFTGLVHVQPGRYFLKVNAVVTNLDRVAASHRENWSEVTSVSGDAPNTPGLRQMHSEDAVWRKTTGITAPTFATLTADELQILDGDFAVTDKVTCDGIRNVFAYKMFLKKVAFKDKLSSLAASPTLKIYTSIDSTTPISGTWTLLATITPNSTKVEIHAFVPSSPVYTTGLWVTQDKNGGSSTCDWYSVQVVGDYVKPDFSIVTLNTGEIDEEYVSLPSPMKNLQGAKTVTRDVIIVNNTAVDRATVVQALPARYGGDTKITGEISVRDPETNGIIRRKAFPAGAGQVLRLRYSILAADNDLSGLHYIKLKLKDYVLALSHFWDNASSSLDWLLVNVSTGAVVTTVVPLGGAYFPGTATIGTNDAAAYLCELTGTTLYIRRVDATTGALIDVFQVTGAAGNGFLVILNDTLYLMEYVAGAAVGYMIPNVSTIAANAVIDATTVGTFPTLTTWHPNDSTNWIVIDPDAPTFVCKKNTTNGGQLVSYSPDLTTAGQHWQVDASHVAHANFGAVASNAICYDELTGRIYRFRAPAGGVIGVEGYPTPGGTSGSPTLADTYVTIIGTLGTAYRAFTLGTKIYVMFGLRYMYQFDLPTFANPTLLWDHGSLFLNDEGVAAVVDF